MALIEIKNLAKSFGGVKAVRDISLVGESDQIVCIIGPNGAGKTTLFNLISGIYKPDSGDIIFEGIVLNGKPQFEIAQFGISRTFQNIRLFKGLTVLENVMTALDSQKEYNILSAMLRLPVKRRTETKNRKKAMDALEIVGILKYKDEHPANLPYGIQRKVELARAIVSDPKLLMLDEPAAGLNPIEVSDFIELVSLLKNRFHFGILIIEHRMQVVSELSEYIYVVNFGSLLTHGNYQEISSNPEVIKAYIGDEKGYA